MAFRVCSSIKKRFQSFLSKFNLLPIIFLVLILTLASCMKRVSITSNTFADVRSIPNGFSGDYSFCIVPANQNNQLFAKEVGAKIAEILKYKGYTILGVDQADYCLIFDLGITSSRSTVNVPKYVPGQNQVKQGNIYGNRGWAIGSYEEETRSSGSIVYVPKECILFTRELHVQVYDASLYRKKKKEEQVWQGSAVSSGESGDLRELLDYLLVSVFKNFGKDTKKSMHETVYMSSNYLKDNLQVFAKERRKLEII